MQGRHYSNLARTSPWIAERRALRGSRFRGNDDTWSGISESELCTSPGGFYAVPVWSVERVGWSGVFEEVVGFFFEFVHEFIEEVQFVTFFAGSALAVEEVVLIQMVVVGGIERKLRAFDSASEGAGENVVRHVDGRTPGGVFSYESVEVFYEFFSLLSS